MVAYMREIIIFPLTTDESSITFNVKCKEIWVSNPPTGNGGSGSPSGYRVVAELTGISPNEMFILTGSGLDNDRRILKEVS